MQATPVLEAFIAKVREVNYQASHFDPRSDDEIVQLYAGAITPRTRLMMVSHMVNITGSIGVLMRGW